MMDDSANAFETLKKILRHVRDPQALDDHPWVQSLIVQEALAGSPELQGANPGQQLVSAIACLFAQLQPSAPPRQGKRLDPRWGEFGLLAALYFTPFNHGTPFPTSFLEAWARIDQAILYHVYKKPVEALQECDIQRYQLVGSDVEFGSASTLSDWHKKGLQRFTEMIQDRERFLSRTQGKPSVILEPDPSRSLEPSRLRTVRFRRSLWLTVTLTLLLGLGLGSFKAWKIYQSGMLVYHDVTNLQELLSAPLEIKTVDTAVPLLRTLQGDLSSFKAEAGPFLWLSPKLSWVPVYGNDLASAPVLVELSQHLVNAALHAGDAAKPALDTIDKPGASLDPADLTALLVQSQPALGRARDELDMALIQRERLDVDHLSPRLRTLFVDRLDPMIRLADDGVSLGMALPGVVGAAEAGPKTYLLLVQNEDELRTTGGFITAIGNLVIYNGRIISLDFEGVDDQEDWTKPYPAAPWQLQEYMNSPVLLLRDANWFTDFPTTALWAEYLYAYTHSHSVDGVVALDQHFLVMILAQLGPLQVDGVDYPITDENVIQYMRDAKNPPTGGTVPADWTRKDFIRKIAASVLEEIEAGNQDWAEIADVLLRALDQRHLLLQFDDSVISELIAERGWDNAVRPGTGDFLMVTDTNVGFNKTNAVVDVGLTYDIDLSDLDSPVSTLTLTHQNNADPNVPCIHWDTEDEITGEDSYPIDRCYWSYVRVYKQAGVELLDATAHAIPGSWMILDEDVPARVDALEEEIAGVQGFGTLLVVPGGQTLSTSFRFALPPDILSSQAGSNELTLHIHLRKQPGTLQNPLTIRVHLPTHALLKIIPPGATVQNNDLMLQTNLLTDVEFDVVFTIPYRPSP